MIPPTGRDQALRELNMRITGAAGRAVPPHVVVRLVYALGGADVVHLDAYVERDRDDITGDVVVYTAQHVIVARMDGLATDPTDEPDAGEVSVSVLARSALRRIDLDSARKDRVSGNKAWTAGRRLVFWPGLGRVVLTYAGLDRPVVLPQGEDSENLDDLYPTLLHDLTGKDAQEPPNGQIGRSTGLRIG
jgi:hypothetical protein